MPGTRHLMRCRTVWEARPGERTTGAAPWSREHLVTAEGKPPLAMSAAPAFAGDASRHNPEDLYVMALSSCQMLSYLALAGRAGIEVRSYTDEAEGVLEPAPVAGGTRRMKMKMTRVTLRPRIGVAAGTDIEQALLLVETAHAECFIAGSVSCEVVTQPEVIPV